MRFAILVGARTIGAFCCFFLGLVVIACDSGEGEEPGGSGAGTGGSAGNAGTGGTTASASGGDSAAASGAGGATGGAGGGGSGGNWGSGGGGGAGGAAGNAGGGGSGGSVTIGDVDCSTDPCEPGEICVRDAGDCSITTGRCLPADPAPCSVGQVCGCDGVVYEDACAAYEAGTKPTTLSTCERPAGVVDCGDKFCDSEAEACQIVNDSRCPGGGCQLLCPGMFTATYYQCVDKPADCDSPGGVPCNCAACLPAGSCMLGEYGVTISCNAGCAG